MTFWIRPYGRSEVLSEKAMVTSSQPLATQAGLSILQSGGNAVDAAIAAAAVLDVTEPFSTGCGGDAFALLYSPDMKEPISLNGSGRSGSLATLDDILSNDWVKMPTRGGATVTVPGAMHLWTWMIEKYGALEMSEVLAPAINYAVNGFPVSPIIAAQWKMVLSVLDNEEARRVYTIDGKSPTVGELMYNKDLARTFRAVAESGSDAFYTGEIAETIVETIQVAGGYVAAEDMKAHESEETKAIHTSYHGLKVFEHPPNGQGFAALTMLNMMEGFEFSKMDPMDPERIHLLIETKKLAYADLHAHNADP
ncbi:MAG: gamma-glutamyltransferase, partial [Candidatus Thorarchaeota archaeon]